VITFIVRRLLGAALMLLVVSMVTFAVFFLVPRLAGQTTDQLATQYVGRNPSPTQIHAMEVKLGLDQPIYVQYGRFLKGMWPARTTTTVRTSRTAPHRVSATRSRTSNRSGRRCSARCR